ncbi:O-antigen ligase family protein, partial [Photobacterium sanctipauli]|uniref:O-antigen ligase family protein n=1 Tax=Photobacterium sanctipauli TaxID=1342794 RepID=UPI00055C7021
TSFAIGAIVAGIVALHHIYFLEAPRAYDGKFELTKGYMAIQSGNMAMSLAVFSVIGWFYSLEKGKIKTSVAFILAAALGLTGSLLSGSRGGWVFAPIVIAFVIYQYRYLLSKKVCTCGFIALFITLYFGYPLAEARATRAVTQISNYITNDANSTSVGARFEMWKSAWYSFTESPVLGPGYIEREALKQRQVEEQKVDPIVLKYGRAHNQYFEELSTKGLVGFSVLMSIFAFPLQVFWRRRHSQNIQQKCIAQCGIAHVTLVASYGLTQNYLNHNSGIIFYSVLTVILMSACLSSESKHNKVAC